MARRQRRRSHGEGNIEKLPNGKYRARISMGTIIDAKTGKPKRDVRRGTFGTDEEAVAWKNERLAEKNRGVLTDSRGLTVGRMARPVA